MTTPQNPEDGDTPQDPSNPQNPYGTPPASPPPPPPSPYGAPPAAPPSAPPPSTPPPSTPPPSTPPSAPPAADPAPPTTAIPATGTTPPPYGQPAYGQPTYGQPPAYPQTGPMPGQDVGVGEASKGMAIAALIVAFFGCTCIGAIVSIILSIVVLRRGRDGRNHGKGLAIAAIIISLISLIIGLAAAAGIGYLSSTLTGVDDLKTGQCLTADGLTDKSSDGVSNIDIVSCSKPHDAEVLATGRLTKDEVDNFSDSVCVNPITAAGKADLIVPPLTFNGLSGSNPKSGDKFVCVAYNSDGSKLTSKLGS